MAAATGGGQGLRRAALAEAARTPHTWFIEKRAPLPDLVRTIEEALSAPRGGPDESPNAAAWPNTT